MTANPVRRPKSDTRGMTVRTFRKAGIFVRWAACSLLVAIGGCHQGPHSELTSVKPYADLIGSEYRVVATDVHAYPIYESVTTKNISRVAVIAGVGIGGSEIGSPINIPQGQIIRILSAWRKPLLFEDGIYYRVQLPGAELPQNVPIELELYLGNSGEGVDLNPRAYKKLPSKE